MCGCGWRASVLTDCAQSCPTPCDPMDCSLPSSSVHGIFLARMLEEAAIPFSRGSSRPRDQTCIFCDSGTESGFFFIFIHLFGCVRSYSHPVGSFVVAPGLASCMGSVASGLFTSEPSGNPPHTPRIKTPETAAGQGLEPQRWLRGQKRRRNGASRSGTVCGPCGGAPGGPGALENSVTLPVPSDGPGDF